MTSATRKIIDEIQALGPAEQQEVFETLLLLIDGYRYDDGEITDEELTAAAASAWTVLDGDEK